MFLLVNVTLDFKPALAHGTVHLSKDALSR